MRSLHGGNRRILTEWNRGVPFFVESQTIWVIAERVDDTMNDDNIPIEYCHNLNPTSF